MMKPSEIARSAKKRVVITDLWEQYLLRDKGGAPKKLLANAVLVLTNADVWKGAIAWDEFSERIVITKPCPAGDVGPWGDVSDVNTATWLQRSVFRLEVGPAMVAEAARAVADKNRVHPLKERLSVLTWDGIARLDTWTTKYLGAEDTPVHREIGVRWTLGAVARAFEPGCQVDAALILEGEQGRGKSSAIRVLAMGFFTDELADVGNKDAAMQLHGAWIIELAELDAIGRAEASRVKSFLTRRVDRYRAPYGRHVAEHPRHCVFAGSVNHNDYLRDETGGRRFLPVEVGTINLAALKADVEQLWAEAVVRHRAGEHTYTADEALRALIGDHTAQRYQEDAWHETIKTFAQVRDSLSVAEVLEHVGVKRENWTQYDAMRVSKCLKSLGYKRHQLRFGTRREWRYLSPSHHAVTSKTSSLVTDSNAENKGVVSTSPVSPPSFSNSNTYINAGGLIGTGGDVGDVGDTGDGHAFADLVGEGDDA